MNQGRAPSVSRRALLEGGKKVLERAGYVGSAREWERRAKVAEEPPKGRRHLEERSVSEKCYT